MLLSYSHRFIYFHIAKTGGMSVRKILDGYSEEPEKFKIRRPLPIVNDKPNPLYVIWKTLLLHARSRDALKELPAEVFDGFYKFAFVRNPWDWQVSMYHFILGEPSSTAYPLVKSLGCFDAYIEAVVGTEFPYPKGTTKFQSEMVVDDAGNLIVDFLGRYETLNQDFSHICRKIGVDASLPHLNRSRHQDYRSYYNKHTKKLIEDHYARDNEFFGFDFNGLTFDRQALYREA